MASPTVLDIQAIDPNLKTGPSRIMSGPCKMGAITPGTSYGFATWLYVGGAGNVSLTCWDGTTVTLTGLVAGVFHPIYSTNVNVSGTTATDLVWAS